MVTISGSKSISGSGLTRVVSQGGQLSVSLYENVSAVNINLTSDYYEGWGSYLNETLGMEISSVDPQNKTISASRNYDPGIDVLVTSSPMSVTIE
jgi:hypothetical protein